MGNLKRNRKIYKKKNQQQYIRSIQTEHIINSLHNCVNRMPAIVYLFYSIFFSTGLNDATEKICKILINRSEKKNYYLFNCTNGIR